MNVSAYQSIDRKGGTSNAIENDELFLSHHFDSEEKGSRQFDRIWIHERPAPPSVKAGRQLFDRHDDSAMEGYQACHSLILQLKNMVL
mmetsp:Transcript_5899/g.8917  ORF Transcript_5899/g.8917 Transcript_5899/m.8917 type:complete len:88 (+) Transcript_5899:425-688(+)